MTYFTRLKKPVKPINVNGLWLREPEKIDAKEISELYKTSFPEHILVKWNVLSNPEELSKQFELENKKWIIAEKNKIIGCCSLEVSEWNRAGEMERVVVSKEERGNGIAKEMCKYLEGIAENIGVKYLFAHSRGPIYAMQKTLDDLGFKTLGIMPVFYVNHDGREIRENFVYQVKLINGGINEIESCDNLIPAANRLKQAIERNDKIY